MRIRNLITPPSNNYISMDLQLSFPALFISLQALLGQRPLAYDVLFRIGETSLEREHAPMEEAPRPVEN